MTFSLILLGVLIISCIFTVGEGVLKELKINKVFCLMLLFLTLILYFLPNIKIYNYSFSWASFILPFMACFVILLKTRRVKNHFKIVLFSLLTFIINFIFNFINFEVYETAILQPYLLLAVVLVVVGMLLTNKASLTFVASFFGLVISEIVFYYARYSNIIEFNWIFGSEKIFSMLLVIVVLSCIIQFLSIKLKKVKTYNKLKKLENQKTN